MALQNPRVLIVCDRLPLPIRGGSDLHVLGVARAMSSFADVGLVSMSPVARAGAPDFVEFWQPGAGPVPDIGTLLGHAFAHRDDPLAPYASAPIVDGVRAAVEDFEPSVVVFYRLQAWRLAQPVLEGLAIPAVLDLDESTVHSVSAMESLGRTDPPMRMRVRFSRILARYEQTAAIEAADVWVCTDIEAAELATLIPPDRISVVPNAVDPNDYSVDAAPHAHREQRRLVFPANFSYPPNEGAARELVDAVAPLLPTYTISLVGSHIPPWLRSLDADNVIVDGPVESIVGHLRSASAALMPIRAGTGSRLKVLECLAAGTPVVSTEVGVEGLNLEPDRHYVLANTPTDFVASAIRLCENPDLVETLTTAGLDVVRRRHSIESLVPVTSAAIRKVSGSHGQGR